MIINPFRTLIIVGSIALGAGKSSSAHAQSFIANAQALDPVSGIQFGGSFGSDGLSFTNSTVSGRLDWNAAENTAIFRRISFDISARIDLSGSFFIPSESISIIISGWFEFDASLEFFDDQALSTLALPNDQFFTDSFAGILGSSEQNRLSGSYSFSGPSETVSGTFSHMPLWVRSGELIFDAADPNELRLIDASAIWAIAAGSPFDLFSDTVDNTDISVQLFSSNFYVPTPFIFAIPEPSAHTLIGGMCLIAFIIFRQMRCIVRCRFSQTR